MKNLAYKEYVSIPYNYLNKPVKKKEHKTGIKDMCFIVSVLWGMSLAFMARVFISHEVLANTYSAVLMLAAVLQVIGNK